MASTDELIKAAFDSAVQKFKVDLDNEKAIEEISKTQSIEDVYKATEELQEEQGKRNGLRNLAKIQPLLEGLRNYAKVIEVFVGAKQNVLSLIWGPIKLLLHWTNNLKQHFDAVVNVLAEIGHLLPEFQRAMDIFSQNVYIKEVLVLFFQDILNFYLIVLKFFNHSYLKIVFEAMWPKQRERILVVKTQMENHSLLLRHEVKFEHIQEAHNAQLKAIEHYDKVEKSLRRQEYKSIKADISPLIYDERLDSITSLTCLGTEAWLLNHPIFKKWLKSKIVSSNFLWLKGIPGSGKTYISSSIVHKMKNDGLRTIYAFMSYTHSSILTALSVLHSLIFQLASGSEALEVLVNELSGQDLKSSFQAATDILKVLLPCVGPTCIVLDGVDEIKDMERRRLLKRLIEVCDCFDTVKIIISSREEADIETILKSFASISIDSNNAGGIQMFVHQKTENWLQEREFLPAAGVEIRELLKPLSSKAKGMFLYAKIVLDNVEYCDSIEQIRRELRVLPESLDDAYSRILHRINSSPEPLKLKARKILGWIGCAPTPMTVQEIEQALVVSSEGVDGHAQVIHAENLRRACGPIVEVVDEYVQFVHFTVQE
ncbi:MAG: hypothetical protein M1814_002787 [Vezdaea aestivalis]|nr:MAG: hypothetical protein M1814_002787 [Vezdaea aestivalis]